MLSKRCPPDGPPVRGGERTSHTTSAGVPFDERDASTRRVRCPLPAGASAVSAERAPLGRADSSVVMVPRALCGTTTVKWEFGNLMFGEEERTHLFEETYKSFAHHTTLQLSIIRIQNLL